MRFPPAIAVEAIAGFDPRAAWTRFERQPDPRELPEAIVVPSESDPAHPLALRAADALIEILDREHVLADARAGKMFGVLVVDAGDAGIGWLRAFSGMLGRRWLVDGYAPPCFDLEAVAEFWPAGEAEISDLTERMAAAPGHERDALASARAERSRALWARLRDAYRLVDAAGSERSLDSLFAPGRPPAGAGDCAGPKLVALAHRLAMRPLALAELWWGPASSERRHARLYPPCRSKCAALLAHMLRTTDDGQGRLDRGSDES